MLTRNSADARNCYCLASYHSPPPPTPPLTTSWNCNLVPRAHRALYAPLHKACWNIMVTTARVRFVPESHVLFIEVKKRNHAISGLPSWKLSWRKRWLRCERDCHKRLWRFQKQSCLERGRKVRFSAWCKAQEAWSSGVSEWPAVQALIKYLQNLWLFLSALNLTGKFWWDSYPRPALLRFSRRSLVESSGYQGLNFPDPRTRLNTICYYTELREDDTGRPH